ncbi:MAG: hypothetical protein ABEK16_04080 [Candidatus Nanohalobium sp.]
MQQLVEKLREVEGVKAVRKRSSTLRIELFAREKSEDIWEIRGDLRKTGQQIRQRLEEAREEGLIENWNWTQKPEKKYGDTPIETEKVSDRKPLGHRPPYYTVSVQE